MLSDEVDHIVQLHWQSLQLNLIKRALSFLWHVLNLDQKVGERLIFKILVAEIDDQNRWLEFLVLLFVFLILLILLVFFLLLLLFLFFLLLFFLFLLLFFLLLRLLVLFVFLFLALFLLI